MTYVWMCKRNLAVAQHDVCVNVQEKLAVASHNVCVAVQENLAVAKNVNIPPTPPPGSQSQWQEEHTKPKKWRQHTAP